MANEDIGLRSERAGDAFAIAELHTLAFADAPNSSVTTIVDLARHGARYRPDLSLVAELDGRIVGHVLFTPLVWRLGGEEVEGVLLSPLGVHPDVQGMGIGRMLVEEGHRRARELGAELAVVLGHPGYYPRFGYRNSMYGTAETELNLRFLSTPNAKADPAAAGNGNAAGLTERRVQPGDIPLLVRMWEYWHGGTDLASPPGKALVDWISPNQSMRSVMLVRGEVVLGYARYSVQAGNQGGVRYFLARDEHAASEAAAYLARVLQAAGGGAEMRSLRLPLHPGSATVSRWSTLLKETAMQNGAVFSAPASASAAISATEPLQGTVRPWEAGMLCPLNEANRRIAEYCDRVAEKPESAGAVIWPVLFELC